MTTLKNVAESEYKMAVDTHTIASSLRVAHHYMDQGDYEIAHRYVEEVLGPLGELVDALRGVTRDIDHFKDLWKGGASADAKREVMEILSSQAARMTPIPGNGTDF